MPREKAPLSPAEKARRKLESVERRNQRKRARDQAELDAQLAREAVERAKPPISDAQKEQEKRERWERHQESWEWREWRQSRECAHGGRGRLSGVRPGRQGMMKGTQIAAGAAGYLL